VEYAQTHGYAVPSEWVFQDEGYSGASLVRPGLEALRDLAAQGQIVAALIYSPDRLSRKYAFQVLLGEELSRCGVDVIYLKSPSGDSPEDQLVVQFQGMIAEYERAQIAERHRRGKRHRAQQGMVNVLSGAPYGYRYVRKTDTSAAYYEVVESEADVVRMVFAIYTQQRFSINAIARLLNERGISTRTGKTRWEQSVVWAMLRNPAYKGKACYGKTEQSPRQRITRPLRQKNGIANRTNCHRDRPRADWIEVAVPALVSEETFALAQEQLAKNKHHSPRRTIEPTLLQGMLVCQQCGYALYRSSTRTSKRKLYYYRCLGSDAYRHFKGALCTNRPVRSDYLDQFVWDQIIGLLDNGTLMQAEIDRRKEAARNSDPRRQRSETLRREQARLGNNVARLITAYQEGLVSLVQLRQRMPELNKKSQSVESELQSLETAAVDQARYLQLAESLDGFRIKLRERAKTLDVCERQQILRLIVKEVLVAPDTLTIRHSIPIPQTDPISNGPLPTGSHPFGASQKPSYLLRSRSNYCSLRCSYLTLRPLAILRYSRLQPFLDQAQDPAIGHAVLHKFHRPFVAHVIEEASNVGVEHPVHALPLDAHRQRVQRLVRAATGTKPIRESLEVHLINLVENGHHGLLYDLVFQRRDAQRTLPPIGLRYVDSS
jgi:site-specific DNA recombinase